MESRPVNLSAGNNAVLKKNTGNTMAFITVSYATSFGSDKLIA